MFHPGKVLKVLKNNEKTVLGFDSSILAMVQMWDENLLTVVCEMGLGEKLKESDIVLIDYDPKYSSLPVPRQVIVKIVRGDLAKFVWKEYELRNEKRKSEMNEPAPVPSHTIR